MQYYHHAFQMQGPALLTLAGRGLRRALGGYYIICSKHHQLQGGLWPCGWVSDEKYLVVLWRGKVKSICVNKVL